MADTVEVLHKIDVPGSDPRWPVSVQVERRTTAKEGKERTYINLLLAIGGKKLFIPRRVSGAVAQAIEEASEVASGAYEELLDNSNLVPRRPTRKNFS